MQKLVFLISPVRKITPEIEEKLRAYVADLESQGYKVHWPLRDTNQEDPTGGYRICRTSFRAIIGADEIHIWYDETSGGSHFDMGGVFMIVEMIEMKKKIVIANESEIVDTAPKSFHKVFKYLSSKTG